MVIEPSLIFFNGKIYTVDESHPWAEAVAIAGNRILAVGENGQILSMRAPHTAIVDLDGKLVLPGLCDAHIHFHEWSLGLQQLILHGVKSKELLLEDVSSWSKDMAFDGWIVGRGWNESIWDEAVMPTRQELDEVTGTSQPCILWRSDMHCAVVNSRALEIASISQNSQDPDGGVIGRNVDGVPDGRLFELAINLVTPFIPQPTEVELLDAYRQGMDVLHSLGVTAIHSQRMKDQQEGPISLNALLRLRESQALKLRVNHNVAAHDLPSLGALGLRTAFGDDYLRLGHIKLFTDGTLGSKTAWMLEPLATMESSDPHAHGICLTSPEEMTSTIEAAAEIGFPVSIHAIGDQANREVLDILEELARSVPAPAVPNRIEHVQIIDPSDVSRLAAIGATASVQPIHALDDMAVAGALLQDRADRAYRFGSLAKSGALIALGSDAPVADPNPFVGFHAAIYRRRLDSLTAPAWFPEETMSLEQTIHGYTLGAAIAAGWQDAIGTISPDKRADLIVLDRDLFDIVGRAGIFGDVAACKVVMTVFDGEIVYQDKHASERAA